MDRVQKEEQIASLKAAFDGVQTLVLTSVKGLTVSQVTDLRRRLHDGGVDYRVVKNTLARKAIENTPVSVVSDDFASETAVAWSKTDPAAPAKILLAFKKEVEKFQIRVGYTSGQRLDEAGVKTLSELPSLDELRATLLGTINGVAAKLLAQINAPGQQLAGVLQAKLDKENEGEKA